MKFKGKQCPVCHEAFCDTDDVVVCPECGTPHHRSCYAINGECSNTSLHGLEDYRYTDSDFSEQAEREQYDSFQQPDSFIFGVSKAELAAFMRIEPDSNDYKEKIEQVKIVNFNIYAGLLSPFYQFYKGMRLLGLLMVVPLFFPELSIITAILLLLFNDYVYLRHCAHKIRRIRDFYSQLPRDSQRSIEYYKFLRFKGTPSIMRGAVETFTAYLLIASAINLVG